jgi:hypothetical protein
MPKIVNEDTEGQRLALLVRTVEAWMDRDFVPPEEHADRAAILQLAAAEARAMTLSQRVRMMNAALRCKSYGDDVRAFRAKLHRYILPHFQPQAINT